MTRLAQRLYSILWLHAVRTKRLSWNLVDFTIAMTLWSLINALILYAIFGVEKGRELAIVVIPWLYYTLGVSLTAGWINYYTATGMPEYELYAGVNPIATVAGRIVTTVAAATPPAIAATAILSLRGDPILVAEAAVAALLVGHSYGILITAVGASQGVPGSMLDLFGYASSILGGLLLPIKYFPSWLREIALATPLAPIGEIARAAANPANTWMSLSEAYTLTAAWIASLYTAALIASKLYIAKARREGIRITRY